MNKMDKILINITEEHISIRKYFNNKDYVSVEDLLEAIDNLIYEKDNLEEEMEEVINK
jgi:hypothetical protein